LRGATNDDCTNVSMSSEVIEPHLLTCADAEAGAVCICLVPLAAGVCPRPFQKVLDAVAIVGNMPVVAKSAFCMPVSYMSMTQ
jgi:hypothetical protein